MKKILIIIPTLLLLLTTQSNKVISQENPGCFMVNSSGNTINLNHLCIPSTPKKPVVIKGIELTRTSLLDAESSIPIISGALKNLTDERVTINSATFQLEDIRTGDVTTSLVLDLSMELNPGQTGEFRKPLSSIVELGGRDANQLKIIFFGWD